MFNPPVLGKNQTDDEKLSDSFAASDVEVAKDFDENEERSEKMSEEDDVRDEREDDQNSSSSRESRV